MLTVRSNIVAVVPIFDPSRTEGGLWVPEQAKERCDQGIVKYIGKKVHEIIDVEYGDHVMFSGYDGTLSRDKYEKEIIYIPAEKIVAKLYPPQRDTLLLHLYFKDSPQEEEIKNQLTEIITITGCTLEQAKAVLLAGYKKDTFFQCNYEMVVELLAASISEAPWKNKYKFVDKKATSPDKSSVFK